MDRRVIQVYFEPRFMTDKFKVTAKTRPQTICNHMAKIYERFKKNYLFSGAIETIDDTDDHFDIEKGLYFINITLNDIKYENYIVEQLKTNFQYFYHNEGYKFKIVKSTFGVVYYGK
jgi:hypothetical protein